MSSNTKARPTMSFEENNAATHGGWHLLIIMKPEVKKMVELFVSSYFKSLITNYCIVSFFFLASLQS